MHDTPAIRRLLTLRRFPGFSDADLADLANIAENVVEASYAPGAIIEPPGRPSAIHLVVSGEARAAHQTWGGNTLLGVFELMAGRRLEHAIIATAPTQTLRLDAADFTEVLEDSYTILSSARRMLARRLHAIDIHRSQIMPRHPRVDHEITIERLSMVDRLILLRQQMPFAAGRAQALAALAQSSADVNFPAGMQLVAAGDIALRGLVILSGAVQATNPDGTVVVLGPGEGIGGLEMLGEMPYERTYSAVTPVRALACPVMALFDVMEDHTDFAIGMLARLAGAVLDAQATGPMLCEAQERPSQERLVS
jgi:CRP-like cAMP-binding protein